MVLSRLISERTQDFHQRVLRLTQDYSETRIAWDISQHVLDQVWQDDDNNGNSNNSTSAAASFYCCQACGFPIHPSWNGTTLRVKRPKPPKSLTAKRTLRRRALRQRRKALLQQEQNAKGRNSKARRNLASTTDNNKGTTSGLHLLKDDPTIEPLDRNHLVITCGRCGDKTLLKGLKREPQMSMKKKPPSPPQLSQTNAVDNLSGNFEQLPRLASKRSPPSAQSLRETPKKKASLLDQKLAKKSKKKKKPPAKKSGNLMDFLSSLNNH